MQEFLRLILCVFVFMYMSLCFVDARAINAFTDSEFRRSFVVTSRSHHFFFPIGNFFLVAVCIDYLSTRCRIVYTVCFRSGPFYLFIWFWFSNCTFISHELKWARCSFYRVYSFFVLIVVVAVVVVIVINALLSFLLTCFKYVRWCFWFFFF